MVTASSPIELEGMKGDVITDAVPLDIVPGDDQKMVENGVLDSVADVDEEEEVAAEEEEDNAVDDNDGHENEGKGATEEGGGDDASDTFEDVDESDEQEERIAAGEGGDTVYFDDDDDEDVEEGEDYVLNTDNEEVGDGDDDEEEEELEEEEVDGEGHVFMNEVENNNGLLEGDDASEDKEDGSVGKESVKKGDEEKVGGNSEPKGRRLKTRVMKVVVRNFVEKSMDGAVVEEKKDGEKAPVEEEKGKGNGKEVTEEKGKGVVKKRPRLRKGGKQKGVSGSGEKVASEPTDKPDSKGKEKVRPKRVESMGMVFMCSSRTKQDCYQYKVLGLPASKRNVVEKIYKGMRLFLYDVDLKLMYGIYKAAAPGGYNLEPKAFNSKFPSQVRFTVMEDCIPLAEENFRKVIKANYFSKNKFDCHLNHEQVKNLCKLFAASSKGPNSRRLDARPKAKVMRASTSTRRERPGPSRAVVDGGRKRDRPRALAADEGRHQKRTRRVDEGRPRARNVFPPRNSFSAVVPLEDNYRQRNYLQIHPREVVAPPPVVLPPPYAYERTLERDAYRPAVLVEHHRAPYREPLVVARDPYKLLGPDYRDAFRQQPLPDYRDSYRQDPVLERYDAYRRDRVSEHRDLQAVSVEPRLYEPYSYYSYREREPYQNPVYGENRLPVEPDRFRSYNRTDYRSGGSPVTDYHPTRGLHHRY